MKFTPNDSKFNRTLATVFGSLLALSPSLVAAEQLNGYLPFDGSVLDARSTDHIHGDIFAGDEDDVEVVGVEVSAEFAITNFEVATRPVVLSLIGGITRADADSESNSFNSEAETTLLLGGAKGTWTLTQVPDLKLAAGAYASYIDLEAEATDGGTTVSTDDDELAVVTFASARYLLTPRWDTYATVLISTDSDVQDSGVRAGIVYDTGGQVGFGVEVATPEDTIVTPYITWRANNRLLVNGGISVGGDVEPLVEAQLNWLF